MTAGHDAREPIYADLHQQLDEQEGHNRESARIILPLLFGRYRPRSVLDVGCGLGTWLSVAKELGVAEVAGVEGSWLDPRLARVPASAITTADLEKPFNLGRRFELAMTLEVAEHLSEKAADTFVESLTRHADVVLFSAAIPFQGGHHHVNERFPEYWRKLFAARGYAVFDFIRSEIWQRREILLWLRQNILVFARPSFAAPGGPFAGLEANRPLDLVHPDMYMARVEQLREEHQRFIDALSAGKTLTGERQSDGSLFVRVKD